MLEMDKCLPLQTVTLYVPVYGVQLIRFPASELGDGLL